MSGWKVYRLRDKTGLGDHAADWDGLNQAGYGGHPMLDSRFISGLLRSFGTGSERLCIRYDQEQVTGMCLLRPMGLGFWSSFLPAQTQVGPTMIADCDVQELIRALPGPAIRIDFLCNDPLLKALPESGARPNLTTDHVLTMGVQMDGGFDAYWSERPKKLAQNIGRYQRRLETCGLPNRFAWIAEPAELGLAVTRYAQLESKGWKGKLGTAISESNAQGDFYNELMTRFGSSGNALVFESWLGGQLVASRMAVVSASMVVMLKTSYDEDFEKYAPGRLLLHYTLGALATLHPGKAVEFYTDANPDQLAWATGQRWVQHRSCFRNAGYKTLVESTRWFRGHFFFKRQQSEFGDAALAVECFRHPGEFPADVQKLFEDASTSAELGVPWFRNLVDEVFPQHPGVRFYVLKKSGRPVAALPVLVEDSFLGKRVLALGNFYTSFYQPLLDSSIKRQEFAFLISHVKTTHRSVAVFRFAPMDPDSRAYKLMHEGMKSGGLVPFGFYCFGNWHLTAETSWDAYLKTQTASLRSTIKRMGKKFLADGGTFELLRAESDVERGMAAYGAVYASSWKKPEPFQGFIPGLMKTTAKAHAMRLGIAWLKGKPIAAQLWIVAKGKADIYKVAYDEAYKAYSPGTLVTAQLLEEVLDHDHVSEVDFLIGDDAYKKVWMRHRRERWGIIACNPFNPAGLYFLLRETAGRLMRRKWNVQGLQFFKGGYLMEFFPSWLTKIWVLNRLYRYAMVVYPAYAFRRFGIHAPGLKRLGSDYGGWYAPTAEIGPESVVYSGGIGGDVTFDKALMKLCGCKVFGYDPTPTAIQYVADQRAAGELTDRFHFTPVGLWDSETDLKFFAPKTRGWVGSYSALNLQGSEDREAISVPVKRLSTLMKDNGHTLIDFLKIDIEGAEYRVINEIIEKNMAIRWLGIEFDQPVPFWTTNCAIQRLRTTGYQLCKVDRWNFIFKNTRLVTTTAMA